MDNQEDKYERLIKQISEGDAVGPDGCWKDGWAVNKEVTLQLGCFLVNLLPDGTYNLSDISG